jgi:hypothetical protein
MSFSPGSGDVTVGQDADAPHRRRRHRQERRDLKQNKIVEHFVISKRLEIKESHRMCDLDYVIF